MPKLDEVKTKVRDDVLKQKAIEAARQKAASINAALKSGDFEKAAKAAGLEVKTTELITRGAPIGDAGVSPALEAAAFALPAGGVSDPVVTDNGAAIVKVRRAQGRRRRRAREAEGLAPDRDPQRAEEQVLLRLHDQGAAADEDQHQPRDDRADRRLVYRRG